MKQRLRFFGIAFSPQSFGGSTWYGLVIALFLGTVGGPACSKDQGNHEEASKPSPKSEFDPLKTTKNSIAGLWRISEIRTTRHDSAMELLQSLHADQQTSIKMLVQDQTADSATIQFLVNFPQTATYPQCRVKLEFDGNYCCMRMLRVQLSYLNSNSTESPNGCVSNRLGVPLEPFARQFVDAWTGSPSSPMPSIYHFVYQSNTSSSPIPTNERIRLQNPPPPDKFTPGDSAETEIYLEKL